MVDTPWIIHPFHCWVLKTKNFGNIMWSIWFHF